MNNANKGYTSRWPIEQTFALARDFVERQAVEEMLDTIDHGYISRWTIDQRRAMARDHIAQLADQDILNQRLAPMPSSVPLWRRILRRLQRNSSRYKPSSS